MDLSIKSSLEKYNSQQKQQNSNNNNNNNSNNNLRDEFNNKINDSDIISDYQPKIVNRGFSIDEISKPNNSNFNSDNKRKSNEFKSYSVDKDEAKNILSTHIEQREKEIKRQTKLAEKDKKDSLVYVNYIKEYREQLDGYIKDFYEDNEDRECCYGTTPSPPISNNSNNNNNNDGTIIVVEKGSPIDIQQRKHHIIERSQALSLAIEGTIQSPFQAFSPITFLNQSSSPLQTHLTSALGLPTTKTAATTTLDTLSKSPPLSSLSFWDSPIQKSTNPTNTASTTNTAVTTISPIMEHEQQSTQHPEQYNRLSPSSVPTTPLSIQQTTTTTTTTTSNTIAASSTPTSKDEKESVSLLVNSYHNKDNELERVVNRANTEYARSKLLKSKFEELSQLVYSERQYWSTLIEKRRKEVDYKEKEINRLLMVAENQKKKLMDCTDQITKLKKSLNSISQIRANTIVDIKNINDRFSYESLSNSPGPVGSSSSSSGGSSNGSNIHHNQHHHNNHSSSSGSHHHHHHHYNHIHHSKSISPSKLLSPHHHSISSSLSSSPKTTCIGDNKFHTEEKKELVHLLALSEKKDDEIRRIKDIIEYDTFKTIFFSNKVNELKLILEEESRQVDSLQNQSMLEIKEKDDAIFKVALRAQKERLKSNQLKDEIKRISRVLYQDSLNYKRNNSLKNITNNINVKSPELEPVFMEMGELKQFQDLSLNQYCDENILSTYILGNACPRVSTTTPTSSGHTSAQLYPTSSNPQKQPLISPAILSQSPQKYIPHQHHHLNPNLSPRPNYYIPQSPQQSNENVSGNDEPVQKPNSVSSSINIPSSIRRSFSHDNMNINNNNSVNNSGQSSSLSNTSVFSPNVNNSSYNSISSMSSMMLMNSGNNHQFLIGSPSEMIMHKLKEIERLNKESLQKDQELNQVKKIAEAERSRLSLLKDKFKELRNELIEKESYNNSSKT